MSIPVLVDGNIPTRYTCDGADVSLPVRWDGVPHDAASLAVFVLNVRSVRKKLFFDWGLTNIRPQAGGIPAGATPSAAIVARNGFGVTGYSLCPPARHRELYLVKVFALPHPLAVQVGERARGLYHSAERSGRLVGSAFAIYERATRPTTSKDAP